MLRRRIAQPATSQDALNEQSNLPPLPKDVLNIIFSYCGINSLPRIARACKNFKNIAYELRINNPTTFPLKLRDLKSAIIEPNTYDH